MGRPTVSGEDAQGAKSTRVALSVPPSQLKWVQEMSELMFIPATAGTITSLLDAVQGLLKLELRRIPLTVGEAGCIADVLNGALVLSPPVLGPVLYAELSDAFSFAQGGASYGTKWSIDEQALAKRMLAIGPTADLALRIAIAQWWKTPDKRSDEAGFRAVGLNIVTH
jgi:hypothetical protein